MLCGLEVDAAVGSCEHHYAVGAALVRPSLRRPCRLTLQAAQAPLIICVSTVHCRPLASGTNTTEACPLLTSTDCDRAAAWRGSPISAYRHVFSAHEMLPSDPMKAYAITGQNIHPTDRPGWRRRLRCSG